MAKRFSDTLIWEKEWFMKLTPKHKCLFRYLTERCDPAGVWEPNWTLATIYIGEKVDRSDLALLNDQIVILENGKIWLSGFIIFQYGKLSDKSPAHIPVFKSIEKNNLFDRVFNRVSNTLMEKDMDKEKEMVMEEEKEKEEERLRSVESKSFIQNDFNENFIQAFDEITCERYKIHFKEINLEEELKLFRLKCDNDPDTYSTRDPAGLRTAFQYQLKTANKKTNGINGANDKRSAEIISRRTAFSKRHSTGA